MRWVGPALAADYLRLERRFDASPFSSDAARPVLGRSIGAVHLALSRLCGAGWLARLGRSEYVALGPYWVQPARPDPLDTIRDPRPRAVLALTAAGLLRTYGPRLRALALFGSRARGEGRPESGLDLLVVADSIPDRPTERLEELRDVSERVDRYSRRRHAPALEYPSPQFVVLTPQELVGEPPLLLDLTEDARVLLNPEDTLGSVLRELKRKLAKHGSRRVHSADAGTYWVLKPGAKFGEVGAL
jgi:hypothetical protein